MWNPAADFINLIFPERCIFCDKKSKNFICNDCLKYFHPYNGRRCSVCSKPVMEDNIVCPLCLGNSAYKKGYSLWNYDNQYVRHFIHMIKFQNKPEVVKILFQFKDHIKSLSIFNNADYLIFVPMHRDDIKKRGYNQAAIIAKTLSKITGIKIRYNMLFKIKRTKAQVGLNMNQRIKNLTGAFRANKTENVKKVVIVDDVFTTGSTIKECAKVLNRQGTISNFFTLAATPSNPGA